MSKLNISKLGRGVAAVALTASIVAVGAGSAYAATNTRIFGGGATLPELAYRDLFNCYGVTGPAGHLGDLGSIPVSCTGTGVAPVLKNTEFLYAGEGSGAGRSAFRANNPNNLNRAPGPDGRPIASAFDAQFFGVGWGTSWVPGTDPKYPSHHFSGSDAVLPASELATYNANLNDGNVANAATTNRGGPAKQIPSLIANINIAYNSKDGNGNALTENGTLLPGNNSKVQFSTNTWCGIFTGAINTWNDGEITADNGATQLGAGPITVFYRGDGSGTTFHFANALINQCGAVGSTAHPPRSTHPIPLNFWSGVAGNNSGGDIVVNDSFFKNAAAVPGVLPTNFTAQPGNFNMLLGMDGTNGGIGYLSADFVGPHATGNDFLGKPIAKSANLQNVDSFGGAPAYVAPISANATTALASLTPPVCPAKDPKTGPGACDQNPLDWALTNGAPSGPSSYPISGFTFFETYSCYADAKVFKALGGKKGYFAFHYGLVKPGMADAIITDNGFAPVPAAWKTAIQNLMINNKNTAIQAGGKKLCVGHNGVL
jgi:ABC-type phosphate transport system substrate-binding protein